MNLDETARAGDPKELRAAFAAARAALEPSSGPDSADPGARAARTALADSVVRALFERFVPGGAVLATGGYGRRELAPRSDLDVLVLFDGQDARAVEPFLRALWDAGLEPGSAVRTVDAALGSLSKDLHAATATLQGRLVAGDRAPFERLRDGIAGAFRKNDVARFARAKIDETRERHQKRGGTIFLLAPDLKEGRGTLRDLELVRLLAALAPWLAIEGAPVEDAGDAGGDLVLPALATADRALARWLELGADEAKELARAEALLAASRAAVHELEPVRSERIGRAIEDQLASRFGYKDQGGRLGAEDFLRDVYLAAKTIDRARRLIEARVLPAIEKRAHAPRRRVAPGIAAVGNELHLEPDALKEGGLARAVQLFVVAHRTKREVSLAAREAVRRALARAPLAEREPFRRDPPAVASFREILGGAAVASTLRAMHDAGLLDELLPEFGALDCLAQADPYHAYTVDEHSLAAVAALEGEPAAPDGGAVPPQGPPEREDRVREELFDSVSRRDLLRLGLLLHDAGKVDGAQGHTERGVALVPDVARRLGLGLDEERHVRFLVAHHLTLSRLAEKREVDAPETVETLLNAVDRDAERLDHLYLLTCADVRAVSPRAFSRWKDVLITRLYERARDQLAGVPPPPRLADEEAFVRELAPRLAPPLDEATLRRHLSLVPASYLSEVDPAELLLHLELVAELEKRGPTKPAPVAFRHAPEEGFDRVYVATYDRPALLSAICGALSGAGLDLQAASAFTRRDGLVLDRFAVSMEGGHASAEKWTDVHRTLERVLAGELDPRDLIAARARRYLTSSGALEAPARRPPIRVRTSNDTTARTTVVDVSAPDRPGLLHDLTRTLSSLGLDIRLAKIATKGNRAVDVFYVSTQDGAKVEDEAALAKIRDALAAAASPTGAP